MLERRNFVILRIDFVNRSLLRYEMNVSQQKLALFFHLECFGNKKYILEFTKQTAEFNEFSENISK